MSTENATNILEVAVVISSKHDLPEYGTEQSAGLDLRASIDEAITLNQYRLIPTGLKIALPAGTEAQVRPRSGLAYNTRNYDA